MKHAHLTKQNVLNGKLIVQQCCIHSHIYLPKMYLLVHWFVHGMRSIWRNWYWDRHVACNYYTYCGQHWMTLCKRKTTTIKNLKVSIILSLVANSFRNIFSHRSIFHLLRFVFQINQFSNIFFFSFRWTNQSSSYRFMI